MDDTLFKYELIYECPHCNDKYKKLIKESDRIEDTGVCPFCYSPTRLASMKSTKNINNNVTEVITDLEPGIVISFSVKTRKGVLKGRFLGYDQTINQIFIKMEGKFKGELITAPADKTLIHSYFKGNICHLVSSKTKKQQRILNKLNKILHHLGVSLWNPAKHSSINSLGKPTLTFYQRKMQVAI